MQALADRFIYRDGWLYKKSNGNKCTLTNNMGYIRVSWDRGSLGRVREYAHRLIWFMHHGDIPKGAEIDHIDMDKTNNCITNLRAVTRSGNAQNQRHKGYSFERRSGKYKAEIKLHGKTTWLGLHNTEADARTAYLNAKAKLHPVASQGALVY